MKYSCGLLDDDPMENRAYRWITGAHWSALPADVEHELRVWLAIPGFSASWHTHNFRVGPDRIRPLIGNYERFSRKWGRPGSRPPARTV